MTAFITDAATAIPARSKTRVKGEAVTSSLFAEASSEGSE